MKKMRIAAKMSRGDEMYPRTTHAEFGTAMDEAKAAGVEVLFLKCHVEPETLVIVD